ncbi:thioredoxin family protein [Salirhabdus salicampi]|uniref:thioredoxin family protein n=1 Tax=Salirhabdus salicampi TaxID=476102 RepID=UPI00266D1EAB|nr:thioredoxin family protein [Salirhabdus salicampi]
MDPVVSSVAAEMEGPAFYSVDVDEAPGIAQKFGIMSIPTMVLVKNGEEKDRVSGVVPEEAIKDFASQ